MVEQNKISEESVLAALSKVQEPELHRDLVSLNMIHDFKIESGTGQLHDYADNACLPAKNADRA